MTAFGSVGKINDQDEAADNEVCESVIEEEITVQNETPQQHRDVKKSNSTLRCLLYSPRSAGLTASP